MSDENLNAEAGYVIGKEDGGIVTLNGGTEISLILPKKNVNDKVDSVFVVLTAIYIKLTKDPSFMQEMYEWASADLARIEEESEDHVEVLEGNSKDSDT